MQKLVATKSKMRDDEIYHYDYCSERLEFDFVERPLYRLSELKEIEWLKYERNLEELWVRYSTITNLRGLEPLGKIKRLFLCRNKIREISVLKNKPYLTYLNLSWNELQEIHGDRLEPCKSLIYLNVIMNPIKRIKDLNKIRQLRELWLPYEVLLSNDIRALELPPNLETIYFVSNPLLEADKSNLEFYENYPPIPSLEAFIPRSRIVTVAYGYCAIVAFIKKNRCPTLIRRVLRDEIYKRHKMNLHKREDFELLKAWFTDAQPCCAICDAPLEFKTLTWDFERNTPAWRCSCNYETNFEHLFMWSNYTWHTLHL
jgi:Leucine-rich repeat (LRR) protein